MTIKKIHRQVIKWCVFSISVPLLFSCTQSEGYGGTSEIKGVLVTKYYNDDYSLLIREEPAVDEDVFILFGNEDFVGDKVATSHTGAFEFQFLNEGDYRLYYMSEDSTTVSNEEKTVIIDLQLNSGQSADQGIIYRLETLDFNDGSGKISGKVEKINYKNTTAYPFLEIKDITWAQDEEVYIVYGDHSYFDERIKTNYDGYFEFDQLIPGEYRVFVYSEDITGGTADILIEKVATITLEGESIDLGKFTIEQL